jgi:hypothetical protein
MNITDHYIARSKLANAILKINPEERLHYFDLMKILNNLYAEHNAAINELRLRPNAVTIKIKVNTLYRQYFRLRNDLELSITLAIIFAQQT